MIIYSNIKIDNNLNGTALLRDVFRKHWINAVQLYKQHGYDTLSGRNVTVCATNNDHQINISTVDSLLIDYNVIYLATMHKISATGKSILTVNSFDNFVCEYSVFFKLMSHWREIDYTEDSEYAINVSNALMLEYQNITVRHTNFLKVDE
jgi:hypothetical protein